MEISKIKLAIINYIERELAAEMKASEKLMFYFGSFLGGSAIEKKLLEFASLPLAKDLGVLAADGGINTDKVIEAMRYTIDKLGGEYAFDGLTINGRAYFKGFKFKAQDIDVLKKYIDAMGV